MTCKWKREVVYHGTFWKVPRRRYHPFPLNWLLSRPGVREAMANVRAGHLDVDRCAGVTAAAEYLYLKGRQ